MGVDEGRLKELDEQLAGIQYGMVASVVSSKPNIAAVTKVQVNASQTIRYQGERTDINAWRIYLGPWQAKPGMNTAQVPPITDGTPTVPPADGVDSQLAQPFPLPQYNVDQALAFEPALQCFALVKWGTGGAIMTAYVDWPVRGLLCQVSACYVEINALAVLVAPVDDLDDATQLPNLPATLADEPGGGDAVAAATFTYRFQSKPWATQPVNPSTGRQGITFIVPPMARSVRFLWDNTKSGGDTGYALGAFILLCRADATDEFDGEYIYSFAAGDIGDPRDSLHIPATTAYVRVEFDFTAIDPDKRVAGVGAVFELDL